MDKDRSGDPADQRILIHELTGEIEALRRKRQDQWRDGGHPDAKRFSQEELTDLACPSYKNLLLGRTNRLPTRATVLAIADYLECSIHETNDLLLAAQYLPEVVELRDDQYQAALERARVLMHALPLPTALVSHGWYLEDSNATFLQMTRLPPVQSLPRAKRSALHLAFDHEFALRGTWTPSSEAWTGNVRGVIALFQYVHRPFQREDWYRSLIIDLTTYPEFVPMCEQLAQEPPNEDGTFVNQMQSDLFPQPYTDRSFSISFGPNAFPQLIVGVPVDEAARQHYQAIGCTVTETRWEQVLLLGDGDGA